MGVVNGPGSSVVGNVVLWNDTTGTTVSDSGNTLSINGLSDALNDTTNSNLVLGSKPTFSTGVDNTIIGDGATGGGTRSNNVVIGFNANANSGSFNVAIGGGGTNCSSAGGVAVGYGATSDNQGVSIGYGANCGSGSINIGYGINASYTNAIGIGASPSGNNVAQIGNSSTTDIYFGDGSAILHGALGSNRTSCRVATTAALTATYNNGTSGVGATLTNSGTQAALSIDGVSLAVNDRVLVKNQATAAQNGIYTVTTVGSGSTNWVLTRATDFNKASIAGVVEGAFTVISEGTANSTMLWIETGAGPFTIGTTAISFSTLKGTSSAPTFQYLTSGSSATYTTPANCRAIRVKAFAGGGGGGSDEAGTPQNGGNGGDTIFNSVHAKGGTGGSAGASGSGGAGGRGTTAGTGTATFRILGSAGTGAGRGAAGGAYSGGCGGSSPLGGAGNSAQGDADGNAAFANSGSGGGGAGAGNNAGGGGGQAGEYFELYISSPSATYTYTIGAAGAATTTGTKNGAAGGTGMIIVEEYY